MRVTTRLDVLDKMMLEEAQRAERLIINALSALGERCVNRVKDRPGDKSWYDQTGNLRSSIGYVVVQNGQIVTLSEFNQVKHGTEGVKTGKALAIELAKRYTHDYVLIVVAGMNYASVVESLDNKDVLASTELWARKELPKVLKILEKRLSK